MIYKRQGNISVSNNNPYESPEAADHPLQPVRTNNTRELFGLTKEDLWAYVGWVLLVAGCFAPKVWMVAVLFVLSTLCIVVHLVTTIPKLSRRSNMHAGLKVYGIINEVCVVLMQIAVIAGRVIYLWAYR